MVEKSLKFYQKTKQFNVALKSFVSRYVEEIRNEDVYLSQHYMDEIIQTISERGH